MCHFAPLYDKTTTVIWLFQCRDFEIMMVIRIPLSPCCVGLAIGNVVASRTYCTFLFPCCACSLKSLGKSNYNQDCRISDVTHNGKTLPRRTIMLYCSGCGRFSWMDFQKLQRKVMPEFPSSNSMCTLPFPLHPWITEINFAKVT